MRIPLGVHARAYERGREVTVDGNAPLLSVRDLLGRTCIAISRDTADKHAANALARHRLVDEVAERRLRTDCKSLSMESLAPLGMTTWSAGSSLRMPRQERRTHRCLVSMTQPMICL